MGLFTNGFEKALYKYVFDTPFSGYTPVSKASLSDIIIDFCASVAHNKQILPNGVAKKDYERTFYSCYALGIELLSMIAPEDEVEQAVKAAYSTFSKTAMNSGAPISLVSERLDLIKRCVDNADTFATQKEEAGVSYYDAFKVAYLVFFKAEVCERSNNGLVDEIEKFQVVMEEFIKGL